MTYRLRQLLFDDSGQDLIEYALLSTAIGFAAITAVDLLMGSMKTTYSSWDSSVQDIWEIQNPMADPPPPTP
jgi:Flp pilus assembly pilin Flp